MVHRLMTTPVPFCHVKIALKLPEVAHTSMWISRPHVYALVGYKKASKVLNNHIFTSFFSQTIFTHLDCTRKH